MDEDQGLTKTSMETIIEHGHQVIGVFAPGDETGDEDDFVPFSYTVGRSMKDRPELLITGPLPIGMQGVILNDLAAYDDEHLLRPGTDLAPNTILRGMPVRIVAADPVAAEMNQALHLFGDDITALQMLWPDKHGRLPGDPGFEIPEGVQPTFEPRGDDKPE